MRRIPDLTRSQRCSRGIDETYIAVIENRANDPVKYDKAGHCIRLSPPRDHKWRPDVEDLHPVKGEYSHAEAGSDAKQLVDYA
jgi:hypothetical protein